MNNIKWGREKIQLADKSKANIRASSAVAIVGIFICTLFLCIAVTGSTRETNIALSDVEYAVAASAGITDDVYHDATEASKNGYDGAVMASADSGLSATMNDGEWSFWSYLEYVITKMIGEAG